MIDDIVTVVDGDGRSIDCVITAVMDHEEGQFALLANYQHLEDETINEIEMFIFRVIYDDGDEPGEDDGSIVHFETIDDMALFEAVRDEFKAMIEEEG